jgi:uncharacterized membrane protein YtjA (UPF0391 family)
VQLKALAANAVAMKRQDKQIRAPASDGGRRSAVRTLKEDSAMLSYAIMFLIIALISGVLGFGVVAGTAAWIAKVCFVVFLVLFLVSLFTNRRVEV